MNLGEFGFIEDLHKQFAINNPNEIGIGDDCAVFPKDDKNSYLVSSDLLCEDVHFSFNYTTWEDLGWKSIAVNLSDIAAMGAKAKYILISLAIPKNYFQSKGLNEFYKGVETICNKYNVSLMGGDTSASLKQLFISITVIGISKSNKILFRSGAKPGDFIYTTGYLGDSSYGLNLLINETENKNKDYFLNKHLKPIPRLIEMDYLKKTFNISSAIDLSDGLANDLHHIIKQSKVGADILWEQIPISEELKLNTKQSEIDYFTFRGGEDYEILFTSADKIPDTALKDFRTQLSCIGTINSNLGIVNLNQDNQHIQLKPEGFDHFRKE